MKYAVITSQDKGSKTVFLETNFFQNSAIFSCVKVEVKNVPKEFENYPNKSDLQAALWHKENYKEKKQGFDRIPAGASQ